MIMTQGEDVVDTHKMLPSIWLACLSIAQLMPVVHDAGGQQEQCSWALDTWAYHQKIGS